ncbi:hypothetical protein [Thermomonospora amylolytica]|nr:hypothetical protein [Thermomonospora amylolytica]
MRGGTPREFRDYIDLTLTEADIDVDALTRRHGIDRHELTDQWRD